MASMPVPGICSFVRVTEVYGCVLISAFDKIMTGPYITHHQKLPAHVQAGRSEHKGSINNAVSSHKLHTHHQRGPLVRKSLVMTPILSDSRTGSKAKICRLQGMQLKTSELWVARG